LTFDHNQKSPLASFNLFAPLGDPLPYSTSSHQLTFTRLRFFNTAVYLYMNFSADAGGPFTQQRLLETAMKTMLAAFIFLAEWMFSAGAFAIDPGSASGSPMVEGHPLTW